MLAPSSASTDSALPTTARYQASGTTNALSAQPSQQQRQLHNDDEKDSMPGSSVTASPDASPRLRRRATISFIDQSGHNTNIDDEDNKDDGDDDADGLDATTAELNATATPSSTTNEDQQENKSKVTVVLDEMGDASQMPQQVEEVDGDKEDLPVDEYLEEEEEEVEEYSDDDDDADDAVIDEEIDGEGFSSKKIQPTTVSNADPDVEHADGDGTGADEPRQEDVGDDENELHSILTSNVENMGDMLLQMNAVMTNTKKVTQALHIYKNQEVILNQTSEYESTTLHQLLQELHQTQEECNELKREMKSDRMQTVASLNDELYENESKLISLREQSMALDTEIAELDAEFVLLEQQLFLTDARWVKEENKRRKREKKLRLQRGSMLLKGPTTNADHGGHPHHHHGEDEETVAVTTQSLLTNDKLFNILTTVPSDEQVDAFLQADEDVRPTEPRTLRLLGDFISKIDYSGVGVGNNNKNINATNTSTGLSQKVAQANNSNNVRASSPKKKSGIEGASPPRARAPKVTNIVVPSSPGAATTIHGAATTTPIRSAASSVPSSPQSVLVHMH